jgi:hypothetical protein
MPVMNRDLGKLALAIELTICVPAFLRAADKAPFRPRIPKAWVEAELEHPECSD